LEPTRIYVKPLLQLLENVHVHALAHITGGGITENLPRVLTDKVQALIDLDAWKRPAIFDWLMEQGRIEEDEMLRTFNCGVGMIVCVAAEDEAAALSHLRTAGEDPFLIGELIPGECKVNYVGLT
jgi:phosphoribosylformylglycinamidine cyclo-ligase